MATPALRVSPETGTSTRSEIRPREVLELELELELSQTHMTQKEMLWVEVCALERGTRAVHAHTVSISGSCQYLYNQSNIPKCQPAFTTEKIEPIKVTAFGELTGDGRAIIVRMLSMKAPPAIWAFDSAVFALEQSFFGFFTRVP